MKRTRRMALCAILIALALCLSYMERFIPLQLVVPLPGVKLGLANIVTLMALYLLDGRTAVTVLLLRCLLHTPFSGSLTALAFSVTGGLLALAVMELARRTGLFSVYGVSVLGAAAHNIGQIAAASLLFGSPYIISYLPFLLLVSVLTGLVTGSAASGTFRVLESSGQIPNLSREASYAGASR